MILKVHRFHSWNLYICKSLRYLDFGLPVTDFGLNEIYTLEPVMFAICSLLHYKLQSQNL